MYFFSEKQSQISDKKTILPLQILSVIKQKLMLNVIYSGTCLIQQTKRPGKYEGLYKMS